MAARVSGRSGRRNGSPPVTPKASKPSWAACRATVTMAAADSDRRGDDGPESVRQYVQARLQ